MLRRKAFACMLGSFFGCIIVVLLLICNAIYNEDPYIFWLIFLMCILAFIFILIDVNEMIRLSSFIYLHEDSKSISKPPVEADKDASRLIIRRSPRRAKNAKSE